MQHRESSSGGSGALRLTWSSRIRDRLHEASSLLSRGEKTRRVLIFLSPPSLFMTKHTTRAPTHARRTLKVGGRAPAGHQRKRQLYSTIFWFFFSWNKKKAKDLIQSPTVSGHLALPSFTPSFCPGLASGDKDTVERVCALHTVCV